MVCTSVLLLEIAFVDQLKKNERLEQRKIEECSIFSSLGKISLNHSAIFVTLIKGGAGDKPILNKIVANS